jgi:hypothetical protein
MWQVQSHRTATLRARPAKCPEQGAFLLTTDAALQAARFPMIEIIGTPDPAVSEVGPLRKAHPQIKILVLEGATHGGEQGVLRRPETMAALRELWSGAR